MAFSIHIVSAQDPLILHGYDWNYGVTPFSELLPHITHAPATLLLSLSWTMLLKKRFTYMLKALQAYTTQRPLHRLVFLANMPEEKALFDQHSLHSIFCPHNTFLDERLYHPLRREKVWQGIITARLRPFKRIHLVQELNSCCLITYPTAHDDRHYDEQLWQNIPHLHRPQYEGTTFKNIFNEATLREYFARSHCGLTLSHAEGGCFAANEYLLCGLPVVSTPSIGGRDVFFHPEYTYYCHPNTNGVRLAVEAAQKCPISPMDIRKVCLDRMGFFRQRYTEMLEAEAKVHGYASTYSCDLQKIFVNKMITPYPHKEAAIKHLASLGICQL